jgi:hypothetical protein
MDITFLIGNGFDLSVGLKTRYTDFYRYYFDQAESANAPVDVFKRHIKRNLSTWADAEVALGECTEKYTLEQAQIFRECCDDFLSKLSDYLLLQEKAFINIGKENVIECFLQGITGFQSFLRPSRLLRSINCSKSMPMKLHLLFYQFQLHTVFR